MCVSKPGPFSTWACVLAAHLILSWRLLRFIGEKSVNVLFWDQWDFYDPLFEHKGLCELFRWQHGPHRMGIGLVLTKVVAELSRWDTVVDSFGIGVAIVLS